MACGPLTLGCVADLTSPFPKRKKREESSRTGRMYRRSTVAAVRSAQLPPPWPPTPPPIQTPKQTAPPPLDFSSKLPPSSLSRDLRRGDSMSWRWALARRVAALASDGGVLARQRLLPSSSAGAGALLGRHYCRLPHAAQIRSKVHSPLPSSPPGRRTGCCSLGALWPLLAAVRNVFVFLLDESETCRRIATAPTSLMLATTFGQSVA
jgi:hypothetical protein